MARQKRPTKDLSGDDQQSSDEQPTTRREFVRKAGLTLAMVAAGNSGGAAVKKTVTQAAQKLVTGGQRTLRQRFSEEAKAVLQAGSGSAAASLILTERELVNLASRSSRGTPVAMATLPQTPLKQASSETSMSQLGKGMLHQMQEDLRRALEKPVASRRWAMAIDLRKCIGCSACTVACKSENKLPPGVVYRPVLEEETGSYPNVTRRFMPRPCMQCENPPCVSVCPVGATFRRADGIVEIEYDACIGCRYCIAACPYGARTFDWGLTYTENTASQQAYELEVSFEYGRVWPRKRGSSPISNVRKCQFCVHRFSEGMLPACTTTCVGGATYFGDANDPESLVSQVIAQPNAVRLKEELGTRPKVYYLL